MPRRSRSAPPRCRRKARSKPEAVRPSRARVCRARRARRATGGRSAGASFPHRLAAAGTGGQGKRKARGARCAARFRARDLQRQPHARRADRQKIVAERRERRRVLERVAGEVRKSRKEIRVLRADEARLARLIERIGRILVESVPEPGDRHVTFSTLRGQLRLPVRGELTGRFGAPRGAAGTEAKGVFIRAPEGQPVRAIAGGKVVYADWMRGFGNLLIVDHGEAYLSVYANNESLLKQVGDAVAPGDSIATTGASGGNEESGLYFELRHLGRAFDPLRWVKLK